MCKRVQKCERETEQANVQVLCNTQEANTRMIWQMIEQYTVLCSGINGLCVFVYTNSIYKYQFEHGFVCALVLMSVYGHIWFYFQTFNLSNMCWKPAKTNQH